MDETFRSLKEPLLGGSLCIYMCVCIYKCLLTVQKGTLFVYIG